jgi:hypothetical protein
MVGGVGVVLGLQREAAAAVIASRREIAAEAMATYLLVEVLVFIYGLSTALM